MAKTEKLWFAGDQHGNKLVYRSTSARKGLLEELGRSSARKIYRDKKDGSSRHVGWIVAGRWFDVFEMIPLPEVAK